jgi:hypothetical protein
MSFRENDRVDIVGGSYQGRRGTYLAKVGFRNLTVSVKVDGDSRESRNLKRTSIRALTRPPPSLGRPIPSTTTGRRPVSPEPDSLQDLIDEARDIQRRVADLVHRLEQVNVSGR